MHCPFQKDGFMCPRQIQVDVSQLARACWYEHKVTKCSTWETNGFCRAPNCTLIHDLTEKPMCSECGTNDHGGISHWKPLPACLHLIDSPIPRDARKGGLAEDEMSFRCCGCRSFSVSCDAHKQHKCSCPYCCECGSTEHIEPFPECYHTGDFIEVRHLEAMGRKYRHGGWTPYVDGMAADWHCCGCDDFSNKLCENHRKRLCSCYANGRTELEKIFHGDKFLGRLCSDKLLEREKTCQPS